MNRCTEGVLSNLVVIKPELTFALHTAAVLHTEQLATGFVDCSGLTSTTAAAALLSCLA